MQTLALEVFGPLIAAIALLFAVLGVRGIFRQFGQRETPEERQAAREAFRNRLIHPNSEQVEKGIGGFLPERLIAFYQDHPTLLAEELEITRSSGDHDNATEWIEAFLPLDLESQKFTVDLAGQGWGKGFCFATDGAGNFYWVPVSDVRQQDAPVFFACHDPHGNEQVAASLEEFLSWPRTSHAEQSKSEKGPT